MIRLHEIDTLLAVPQEAYITIKALDAFHIREIARYYGSTITDTDDLVSTEIKRGDVTLNLISKPKWK